MIMNAISIAMLIIVGFSTGFALFCCVMHLIDSFRVRNRKMHLIR